MSGPSEQKRRPRARLSVLIRAGVAGSVAHVAGSATARLVQDSVPVVVRAVPVAVDVGPEADDPMNCCRTTTRSACSRPGAWEEHVLSPCPFAV
jgi:hypothetical protein